MSDCSKEIGLPPLYPPLIQALLSPAIYGPEVDSVKLIETHISWVLLTGSYAYKIKKPVNFGFLDFSSLEKRRICCQDEIRLNNRFKQKLYLEMVPVSGTPDHPVLGGEGEVIEYAVKMKQFPSGFLLSDLAGRGELSAGMIDQLALTVADFHQTVAKAETGSPYGESVEIKHWFDENFQHIKPLVEDESIRQKLKALEDWGDIEWRSQSGLMQSRKQQGKVRECHGDLHLGNITLIDGQVTPFDCIEFNPMLRWIDFISELAFLVMDLLHHKLGGLAFRLLNRYLQETGDYQGLLVLRYYLVYRAMVRAKVAILRSGQCVEADKQHALNEFTSYIDLAESFTRKNQAFLLITHGFSGSGKSMYASRLAEHFKAIHIRSDVERKRLYGYKPDEATDSGIESGIYSKTATADTYKRMLELAEFALDAGFPAIADAAFLKIDQRELFANVARQTITPFLIIDFTASCGELERRIKLRKNDPSEATIEVLRRQQQTAQPLTEAERECSIVIDSESAGSSELLISEAGKRLNL
jgi:aminoglycoside phosphotransferase family enzyme/predicted kinase